MDAARSHTIPVAVRCIWIGTIATILLDYIACYPVGGFPRDGPSADSFLMFNGLLLVAAWAFTRYLRVSPRARRTYPEKGQPVE